MKVALLTVVILGLLVGGGVWVGSRLVARIQAKVDADQALADGPIRPSPIRTPSDSPPTAETPSDTPPTIPVAAVRVLTIDVASLAVHQGRGFIVSADGRIVTRSRVLASGTLLGVVLGDGRTLAASLVKSDAAQGWAELRVEATDLPFLETTDQQPEQGSRAWVQAGDALLPATVAEAYNDAETADSWSIRATGLSPDAGGSAVLNAEGKAYGVLRSSVTDDVERWVVVRLPAN